MLHSRLREAYAPLRERAPWSVRARTRRPECRATIAGFAAVHAIRWQRYWPAWSTVFPCEWTAHASKHQKFGSSCYVPAQYAAVDSTGTNYSELRIGASSISSSMRIGKPLGGPIRCYKLSHSPWYKKSIRSLQRLRPETRRRRTALPGPCNISCRGDLSRPNNEESHAGCEKFESVK
jgi:hypothetical protein